MSAAPDAIGPFTRVHSPDGAEWTWPVYRTGEGPPVIVLHELMGLSDDDRAVGVRIADAGFTVWMPALVGPVPSTSGWDHVRAMGRVCISREIHLLRSGTSRVVTPLRGLASHIRQTSESTGVGVVGMCMSGGFALAMVASGDVLAGVVAEPALPATLPWCAAAPGVSADELARIGERLAGGDAEILYTRFSHDRISPRSRLDAVRATIGTRGLHEDEIPSGKDTDFGRSAHAVLSEESRKHPPGTPGGDRLEQTMQRVIDLFERRLR